MTATQVTISDRPESDAGCVYTNFDHSLDQDVLRTLTQDGSSYGQHSAWDYCGWIWYDGTQWREQVWRFGVPIAEYASADIADLIATVIEEHGDR